MKTTPPTIKALIGDMFASDLQTIVNTVNCVGIMGKGIAQIFKKNYPESGQRNAWNEKQMNQ